MAEIIIIIIITINKEGNWCRRTMWNTYNSGRQLHCRATRARRLLEENNFDKSENVRDTRKQVPKKNFHRLRWKTKVGHPHSKFLMLKTLPPTFCFAFVSAPKAYAHHNTVALSMNLHTHTCTIRCVRSSFRWNCQSSFEKALRLPDEKWSTSSYSKYVRM